MNFLDILYDPEFDEILIYLGQDMDGCYVVFDGNNTYALTKKGYDHTDDIGELT